MYFKGPSLSSRYRFLPSNTEAAHFKQTMHGGPALAPAAQAPTAFCKGAVRGLSVPPGASSGSGSVYFVEDLSRPERAAPPCRPRPRARPPRVAGGCSRQGEPGARRGRQPGQRRDRRPGPGGADRSGAPGGAAGPSCGLSAGCFCRSRRTARER